MKPARPLVTAGRLRFLLIALPLLLVVGAAGPKGCPAIDVQCGDVLDIDYAQYRLNGDLVCGLSAAPYRFAAVTITGEGVHFNLRGYTITRDDGTGRFLREGILVRGANAHINNGSIVDINCPAALSFPEDCAGIRLGEAPGVQINGMSLHNNNIGIVSFSSGDVVGNADGARIHGNDITGNLWRGIALFGFGGATAEGAMITGNDLSDSGGFPPTAFGYWSDNDGVSLIGNVANNCATGGILLWGGEAYSAQRNTIRDNTTLDNGIFGIDADAFEEAFRPRDNLIQSNTSFGNGNHDLGEVIPPVPTPFDDCLNTWMDNDFDVAAPDCIE